ncbi:MAG: transcriptional repressor [Candidatus Paceibacterota bacterium]
MKGASTYMLDTLQARGYRVTKTRRELCTELAKASHPLTIRELAELVNSDEASVYRFVHLLQKEDLVHEITTRGERPRFEFKNEHHHHVVCTGCGKVAHVPCAYTPQVPKDSLSGFAEVNDHDLTFYGTCLACV